MTNGICAAGQCASAPADCARHLNDRRRKLQFARCGGVVARRTKKNFHTRVGFIDRRGFVKVHFLRQSSCPPLETACWGDLYQPNTGPEYHHRNSSKCLNSTLRETRQKNTLKELVLMGGCSSNDITAQGPVSKPLVRRFFGSII
jgi:hypothetical protein